MSQLTPSDTSGLKVNLNKVSRLLRSCPMLSDLIMTGLGQYLGTQPGPIELPGGLSAMNPTMHKFLTDSKILVPDTDQPDSSEILELASNIIENAEPTPDNLEEGNAEINTFKKMYKEYLGGKTESLDQSLTRKFEAGERKKIDYSVVNPVMFAQEKYDLPVNYTDIVADLKTRTKLDFKVGVLFSRYGAVAMQIIDYAVEHEDEIVKSMEETGSAYVPANGVTYILLPNDVGLIPIGSFRDKESSIQSLNAEPTEYGVDALAEMQKHMEGAVNAVLDFAKTPYKTDHTVKLSMKLPRQLMISLGSMKPGEESINEVKRILADSLINIEQGEIVDINVTATGTEAPKLEVTLSFEKRVPFQDEAEIAEETFKSTVLADLDLTTKGGTFETTHSLVRKLFSRILAITNFSATKRKPVSKIITNGALAAALQDIAYFTVDNSGGKSTADAIVAGEPYPVGTLSGFTIYVDPNMKFSDTRVIIGDYELKVKIDNNFI
jgi:hypothetical protein